MIDEKLLKQGEKIVDSGDVENLRGFISENRDIGSPLLKRSAFVVDTTEGMFGPNRPEVVNTLLELGADLNYKGDEYGKNDTPLHTAASFNAVEVAQILINAGAEVNARGGEFDQGTPLTYASFFGFPAIADLLRDNGAIIYNLALAAGAGRLDMVQIFLKKDGTLRADAAATGPVDDLPEQPTFDDPQHVIQRAFQVAVLGGRTEIVHYFLPHDVDVNAKIGVEYSGLEWMHLKDEKADFGEIYGPLLKHAVLREYEEISEMLKQHGGEWERNS